MTMNRLILNGQDQELDIPFEVKIIGTGAKETINVGHGNNVIFTAGGGDRVNLSGNIADYTITSIGNRIYIAHDDGSRVSLSVGGKSIVGFANGKATLDMVFPPGEMPRILLGGAVVGEDPIDHSEVELVKDAELSIENIRVEPENPVVGEVFQLDVDFIETADVETENLSVNLAIGEHFEETIDGSSDQLFEIKNESAMVRFDGLELFEPGDYTVTATVAADNAESVTMEQTFTVMPEFPDALSVTIAYIGAGEVGSAITVEADVAHFGQAETVSFTLQQDDTILSETVALQTDYPGEERVTFTFEDTSTFDPGMMELMLGVEENGVDVEETGEFGLYQANEDYSWAWADPGHSPFSMIGHTIVDRGEVFGDTYVMGTGFLISPGHMMTNAHVLENDWEGYLSDLNSVDFFLGRNGNALFEEQGDNHYRGEAAYLQKDEWGDKWPDTDMAIISLDRDVETIDSQVHFDWFWNARDAEARDLSGQSLFWGGYPSGDVDQGKNDIGNSLFFQWMTEGGFDGYITGYDAYGGASGGIRLSSDMAGAPGASGSPVFFKNDGEQYQFAGAFTGSKNGLPVAANLDPAAYDWALTIVQADGYLLDMDFIDSPWNIADMGPHKDLSDGGSGAAEFQDSLMASLDQQDIQIQGVPAYLGVGSDQVSVI